MNGDHIVAGTGPRSLQTADKVTCARAVLAVQDAVAGLVEVHGGRLVLMSGMAEGFDHLIAWAALRAGVRLWCAIPTRTYGPYYWGRNSLTGQNRLDEFTHIADAAWRRTFVMEDIHGTSAPYLGGVHANMVRNEWMVDGDPTLFRGADEFLAWNPTSAGTADCVRRIDAAGKPWRDLSAPVGLLSDTGPVPPEGADHG